MIRTVKGSELKKKKKKLSDLTLPLTLQFLLEHPLKKIIISEDNSFRKLAHYFFHDERSF